MRQEEALAQLRAMVLTATRGCGTDCTTAITQAVSEWCYRLGAVGVEFEHPWAYRRTDSKSDGRETDGRIDVLARWPKGGRLAIEIDGWDKFISVDKLRLARSAGCRVLWIRWNRHNEPRDNPAADVPTHWVWIAEPRIRRAPAEVVRRFYRERAARKRAEPK